MVDFQRDLEVQQRSKSLAGKTVDLVVTGSIGAIEAPRLARSLRRLGARVRPILSSGAKQFITETSLSWAAGEIALSDFSGLAPHIATGDFLVVAPASASFLSRVAQGFCNDLASTLCTSYLGTQKPVLFAPNYHDSLADSPAIKSNRDILQKFGVSFLPTRKDEGKHKFPEPEILADNISHFYNDLSCPKGTIYINMGSTRAMIDDVRFVGNSSSGQLGSQIATELYRAGFKTWIIAGDSQLYPKVYSKMWKTPEYSQMMTVSNELYGKYDGAICAAAVLDYQPTERLSGKTRSGNSGLSIDLIPTKKIIDKVRPKLPIKVGFKLEPEWNEKTFTTIGKNYQKKYNLSMLVLNGVNRLQPVHEGICWDFNENIHTIPKSIAQGKHEISLKIATHVQKTWDLHQNKR